MKSKLIYKTLIETKFFNLFSYKTGDSLHLFTKNKIGFNEFQNFNLVNCLQLYFDMFSFADDRVINKELFFPTLYDIPIVEQHNFGSFIRIEGISKF